MNFCFFILTHGRPDNVVTLKALKDAGYTGEYYLVVDDEDSKMDEYIKKFGDKVIIFNKEAISKTFDTADNFNNKKTIVYARNVCFNIANELGIDYFMELDDDYLDFSIRFNRKGEFKHKKIKNLDKVIKALLKYYKRTNANAMAFAQGGDFIGGDQGFGKDIRTKRKTMNTILCSNKRPFKFLGRINEDVNTYVKLGSEGKLFLTVNLVAINQKSTQSNKGGMTDVYLESGTYLKSFYTVMYAPSSVKIARMGNKDKRIHHKITWNHTVPCILSEKWRACEV